MSAQPPPPPQPVPLGPALPGHPVRIVVVSGISGAGKSTALHALEDVGYYCVDNLPLPLFSQFVDLLVQTGRSQAALVIDAREGEFLLSFRETLDGLRRQGHQPELLFLDAPDDVLLRRFSETRRRHPLGEDNLRGALEHERHVLAPLREDAQAVVDTGGLTVHQLKGVIQERYGRAAGRLALTLLSFGFKHGLPVEADIVLDVRFLPNPYFVEHLSPLSGTTEAVARFVLQHPDAQEFLRRAQDLLFFYLPRAESEGKAYLTIAIGCTGGRHRSVAVSSELSRRLGTCYQITVRHRDLGRGRD